MQSYELVTIADLLRVPADKRERCVRELLYALMLGELSFGDKAAEYTQSFTWTDDDSRDVSVCHGDEELLRLSITEAGKGE